MAAKLFCFIFSICVLFATNGISQSTTQGTVMAPEDSLNILLANYIVPEDFFVRKTVYTWTTPEQIEELRKSPVLLTRSRSATKGLSEFDQALQDTAFSKFPMAKLLSREKFAKKRFAWANPWATVRGWKGETYGDQLIKITLKDDAIVGQFDENNKQQPFSFYDMHDKPLDTAYVRKNSEKIAAIYHLSTKPGPRSVKQYRYRGSYSGSYARIHRKSSNRTVSSAPFREYVILNESEIQDWEYGTQGIKTEITTELNMLTRLLKQCKIHHIKVKRYILEEHSETNFYNSNSDFWDRYFESICFANNYYLLNKHNLKAIIKNLEKCLKAQGQPVSH